MLATLLADRSLRDDIHGQSVLVVAVADLTAKILGIRALVDDALRIVHVTIVWVATRRRRLGWIREIYEDQATTAGGVARRGTNCVAPVRLLVDHDVVGAANGQAGEEAGNIRLTVERDWARRVDVE